jgi:site-specific recombinase XerD
MVNFNVDSDKKHEYITKTNKSTYTKLLKNFDEFENQKKISCEKFNKSDYRDFFLSLNTSLSTLQQYKTVVNKYIKFLNNDQGENYLNEIDLKELYTNIEIITEKEYFEILKDDGNFQDKAVIVLLWNKVEGEAYSEIINLKYKDLDIEHNVINVGGENSRKPVQINQYEMDVLVKAYNEKKYTDNETLKTKNLKKSDLIIRAVSSRRNQADIYYTISYASFNKRLGDYLKIKLNRKKLHGSNIVKSSILHDIIKKYGAPLSWSKYKKYAEDNDYKVAFDRYKEQYIMLKKMEQQGSIDLIKINNLYEEDTELDNDILDMNKEDVIFNFIIDKEFINFQISKFNGDKLKKKKTKGYNNEHQNNENNNENKDDENDDGIPKEARYHLGICGEQLIYILLHDKDVDLLNELGLKVTDKISLDWYNKSYKLGDKDWKDKSIGEGHDIKIIGKDKILYLEIKTSYNPINYYELTSNEIKANYDYKDNYYVIKIKNMKYVNNNDDKMPIITVIQNPLNLASDNINLIKNISFFV